MNLIEPNSSGLIKCSIKRFGSSSFVGRRCGEERGGEGSRGEERTWRERQGTERDKKPSPLSLSDTFRCANEVQKLWKSVLFLTCDQDLYVHWACSLFFFTRFCRITELYKVRRETN